MIKPTKRKVKKVAKRKNPGTDGYYPFLFFLPKDNDQLGTKKVSKDTWIVDIARFDYGFLDVRWMDNKQLGDLVLTPEVDITIKTHVFYSEKEAMEFIRNWWRK